MSKILNSTLLASTCQLRQVSPNRCGHRPVALRAHPGTNRRGTMAIVIGKLHAMFVGEVAGADLARVIDAATFGEIQTALDEYAVLVFHATALSEQALIDFAARFGPLEPRNGVLTTGITPRISRQLVDISNLDENGGVLGQDDRRRMF